MHDLSDAPRQGDPPPPSMLDWALAYRRAGFSPIPQNLDRSSPIKWKPYQERQPTEAEITEWWSRWPSANIALVLGEVSGLVVIDVDSEAGEASLTGALDGALPACPEVKSTRGRHLYFRHPGGRIKSDRIASDLDCKADKGLITAPPSVHYKSGRQYKFTLGRSLWEVEPPELPAKLLTLARGEPRTTNKPQPGAQEDAVSEYVRSAIEREVGKVTTADEGVRNGALNRSAFSLGQLVGEGSARREHVEHVLLKAATRCGLPETEARAAIDSGLAAGLQTPRNQPVTGGWTDIQTFHLGTQTKGKPMTRKYLTENSLPLGVVGVLFGPGGVGKSLAVLDLCIKVGTRDQYQGLARPPQTFLGPVTEDAAGAVLFITLEDDRDEIHRRTASLDPENKREKAPVFVVPGLNVSGFSPTLIHQKGMAGVLTPFAETGLDSMMADAAKASKHGLKLVVLDPAGDLVTGSEDDAAVIQPLMQRLRTLATKHNCTILLVGHSAKGLATEEGAASRGMRGSGAWTANARWAFALWRPSRDEAQRTLKNSETPVNENNVARVVHGTLTKSNQPGLPGLRSYLQDPDNGLIRDCTDGGRSRRDGEWDRAKDWLFIAVQEAAELGLPYQPRNQAGLHERRADLPPLLRDHFGKTKLENLAKEMCDEGRLVKCRMSGSKAPVWLDVPGGDYAKGEKTSTENGSLSELRKAAGRALQWEE